jgi:hypothetical protein
VGCVSLEQSVPKGIATSAIGLCFLRTGSTKSHLSIGMQLTDVSLTSPTRQGRDPVLADLTIRGIAHTNGLVINSKQASCYWARSDQECGSSSQMKSPDTYPTMPLFRQSKYP